MRLSADIDVILASPPPDADSGEIVGHSRQGRKIRGWRFGDGPHGVSLIGGCHADEPVGPTMLARLTGFLAGLPDDDPRLSQLRWHIVPHTNPDGAQRNAAWSHKPALRPDGKTVYDLAAYLDGAVRERPGDDVEFGFPRGRGDTGARPENRAVASFLAAGAPYTLHGSFHGMAFAAGPWFLIEGDWIDRTADLRQNLRRRVAEQGYEVHDIDRQGEKGFHRIDEGFTTRPDSRAMVAHFEDLGDPATARLFRPSSMEYVRSLGGDPLTLVSEMPLFLLARRVFEEGDPIRPPALGRLLTATGPDELRQRASEIGVEAMPIEDQMRLQLAFLDEGLGAALAARV